MLKPQFKGYARDEYVEPKEELWLQQSNVNELLLLADIKSPSIAFSPPSLLGKGKGHHLSWLSTGSPIFPYSRTPSIHLHPIARHIIPVSHIWGFADSVPHS